MTLISRNWPSVDQFAGDVVKAIEKDVRLGHLLGPFTDIWIAAMVGFLWC